MPTAGLAALLACGHALAHDGYPRIANLWGFGPTARAEDCEKLARYGLLVMGGGGPEDWRKCRAELRRRNPHILMLSTAPLMNIGAPASTPWMKPEWYVRHPDGSLVNWWAGQIHTPNLLLDPCLDALLDQTAKPFGELLSDGSMDGVFYDSVVGHASWLGDLDTDGDGRPDNPADLDPRWQARQNLFFDRLRQRWPRILVLANDVDAGHRAHVNGRLFEGAPLLDRAADGSITPQDAIAVLNEWTTPSAQPGVTFAIMTHPLGWQGWRVGQGNTVSTKGEVDRVRRDFHRMRLGLLTALMTDAYYAYDFGTVWYGLPLWYSEYDAPLGQPKGAAREVFDVPPVVLLDWRAGQPADAFVLDRDSKATPAGIQGDQPDPKAIWTRLFATNPAKVRLEPGRTYRIEAECEVARKATGSFQFNVRTPTGGWEHHDKGIVHCGDPTGSPWRFTVNVVPDDYQDYGLEWHVSGAGALRLRSLKVSMVNQSYLMREFDRGVALLNPTGRPVEVRLSTAMRRLRDPEAPRHVLEVDDDSPGFACQGAWETQAGEGHYAGASYRRAAKPGSTASWSLVAPSTDTYTFLACIPGGKDLTDAAAYSLGGGQPSATLNQRPRDGGWVRLFQRRLTAGVRYSVVLRSGGAGATAADAIRIESAARYNDGATVSRLTLGPLDGTLLLR